MVDPLIIDETTYALALCGSSEWTESEILAYAEEHRPAGTSRGWALVSEGDSRLGGSRQRTPCPDTGRVAVHVVVAV